MIKNTGHLIRVIAAVFALLGLFISVYFSVLLSNNILIIILNAAIGCLISVIVTIPLMGFGEIVERAQRQENILREIRDELKNKK